MIGFKSKRKTIFSCIFAALIISIVTLSVVYAALSTSLKITGSTDVVASTWSVYLSGGNFASSIPTGGSHAVPQSNIYGDYNVSFLAAGHSCTSDTDCIDTISGTSISFVTAPLSKPGDFKVLAFDVVNGGSIDAKLDGFVLNGISSAQDVYLNYYILYSDGTTPSVGDVLTAGSTKSMALVIEFDEDVTSSQLPTTDQSLSLSFTLNYVQN